MKYVTARSMLNAHRGNQLSIFSLNLQKNKFPWLSEKIENEIKQIEKEQHEIELIINSIQDISVREIIKLRYICGLSLKEISEAMHYTVRTVERKITAGNHHIAFIIDCILRRDREKQKRGL